MIPVKIRKFSRSSLGEEDVLSFSFSLRNEEENALDGCIQLTSNCLYQLWNNVATMLKSTFFLCSRKYTVSNGNKGETANTLRPREFVPSKRDPPLFFISSKKQYRFCYENGEKKGKEGSSKDQISKFPSSPPLRIFHAVCHIFARHFAISSNSIQRRVFDEN